MELLNKFSYALKVTLVKIERNIKTQMLCSRNLKTHIFEQKI
jgi:hypothetical protein